MKLDELYRNGLQLNDSVVLFEVVEGDDPPIYRTVTVADVRDLLVWATDVSEAFEAMQKVILGRPE